MAIDKTVFFTSGCLISGRGTTSELVRIGRVAEAFEGIEEVKDLVLSVVTAEVGGWFVGRLEIDFTIRCLS